MKTVELIKYLIGSYMVKEKLEALKGKINTLYLLNQLTDEEFKECIELVDKKINTLEFK